MTHCSFICSFHFFRRKGGWGGGVNKVVYTTHRSEPKLGRGRILHTERLQGSLQYIATDLLHKNL